MGRRKDGTTFPLSVAVSESGQPGHFTGILRDLTDRRRLEWRLAESQLEERRHLARELHDDVGGHLMGIGLLAQALSAQLASVSSPLVAKSRELVENISATHECLRALVQGLMPVDDIPEGLMTALRNLVQRVEQLSDINCRFVCDPPVLVSDSAVAKHLYRIAHEAINNAVRHGKPRHITVTLSIVDRRFVLNVTDDGKGIGDLPPDHAGIGLAAMRQRAELLGGACVVGPGEAGGTTVRCWVPETAAGDTRPVGLAT
jgi:two-component system CheB/CheR fusion protein